MGRHTLAEEPLPHPLDPPARRAQAGSGESTGSHRIVGKKAPRRRMAKWPIACIVLVLLIGLGIAGWNWLDSMSNSRAEAQAVSCDAGNSNIRVITTQSIEKPVALAAAKWNKAKTVVRDHCVHVDVYPFKSSEVLASLTGDAPMDKIGGLPTAWIPESSFWVGELQSKKPELVSAPPLSVANAMSADYPYVGLGDSSVDDTQKRAAQAFRDFLKQPDQQKDFTGAGIKGT
ncbi:hypothetical protein [Amycolatopsis sp. NPDC059657]|uniref:hypothetical protein n=1 Tax=Amycolatopsis sp. NPDC059657 TaxID=3346899 RepID=UPI003670193D